MKNNRIVDAVIFCIVLTVIAVSAYMAHDARITVLNQQQISKLHVLEQREAFRVAQIAQQEALKAAHELSESRWRQFFRSNPEAIVPKQFFKRETIEELESVNETMAPTLPNGRSEFLFRPDPKPPFEPMPGPATSILEAPIKNQP